jgi:hypothetical protein
MTLSRKNSNAMKFREREGRGQKTALNATDEDYE